METEAFNQLVTMGPPSTATPVPRLDTITAADLQAKELPPLTFVVDGLIPAGVSLLCSPPKYGKSWLALDLCLAVSTGVPFLGHPTIQSECLYLALEDSERRLKSRLDRLLDGEEAPANCHLATSSDTIDTGLLQELEEFMQTYPHTSLTPTRITH